MSDEAEGLGRRDHWVGERLLCLFGRAFSRLANLPASSRWSLSSIQGSWAVRLRISPLLAVRTLIVRDLLEDASAIIQARSPGFVVR
jgi:hypothetical protein